MFTYKFFTRNGVLQLRLRNNNVKKDVSLSVPATEDELAIAETETKGRARVKRGELSKRIEYYTAILNRISRMLYDEMRTGTDVSEIKRMFEEEVGIAPKASVKKDLFMPWYVKFMDSRKPSTREIYRHTLKKITDYDADIKSRTFDAINFAWLTDFEAFCARTSVKNSRNIHLRNIRAVFNNAIDNEITTAYPFRRFKIRPEPTRKRALSVEDLREIFSYPVEDYAEIYRDLFKLIFMLCGINTVDLFRLKNITRDGRVEYKRAKTGKLYSIKVEPEAMEIIDKYRGESGLLCISDRWSDHRNFRHQMNKALQLIGAPRAGLGGRKGVGKWPELTTYYARHSWATIARKIGVAVDDIAFALGHSDPRHETTFIYIDDDEVRDAVDAANRKVLDWVLYGKLQ